MYRKHIRRMGTQATIVACALILVIAAQAAPPNTFLTPADIGPGNFWTLDYWDFNPAESPSAAIAIAPVALPGYGDSALQLLPGDGVGGSGCGRLGGKAHFGTQALDGVPLGSLSELSFSYMADVMGYSTDPQVRDNGNISPYINVFVDRNGDGEWYGADDTILIYEPLYTRGNGFVVEDVWYTDNALATGRWHTAAQTLPGVGAGSPTNPTDTWAEIMAVDVGDGRTVGQLKIVNPIPGCDGAGVSSDEGTGSGLIFVAGQKSGDSFAGSSFFIEGIRLAYGATPAQDIDFGLAHCSTDCYVSPSGDDGNSGIDADNALKTIQMGVNKVDAGGTVHVAAGTYSERVVVTKSVTVTGAGEGATVLGLPAFTPAPSETVTQLEINGAVTANISGLTVSGPLPNPSGCSNRYTGIWALGGATANLSNVTVTDIHLGSTGLFGCQTGLAIYYGQGTVNGTTAAGTLDHVTVTRFQKNGITVGSTGSDVTITNSTVTEGTLDLSPYIAQNGIQISRGAVGDVGNTIVDGMSCLIPVTCGPDATGSSGILIYQAGSGISFSNVAVSNADLGLAMVDSGIVTFDGGSITDSVQYVSYNDGGTLTLTGTTIDGSLRGLLTTPGAKDAATIVSGGSVTDIAEIAFHVVDETPGFSAAASSITYATITGNGDGIVYEGAGSIGATCNWWGTFTGPSGTGSGEGDTVSTGVVFSPWRITSAANGPCVTVENPDKLAKMSGDEQHTAIGTTFAQPLVVKLTDANDNPIEGVEVQFAVLTRTAAAIFTPGTGTDITDENGIASIVVAADNEVGIYEVVANVSTVYTSFMLTNDPAEATAPADLDAVATGATKVQVTWTDTATDLDTLELMRSDDGGATFTPIAAPANTDTAYDDSGLTCGTTYSYKLVVTNAAGTAESNTDTVTTNACGELLANGSFEAPLTSTWKGARLSGDKRKTNAADAYDGTAFLLFKGSAAENSMYKQSVGDLSALTPGDTLYLSAAFKSTAAAPKLTIQAVVKYGSIKHKVKLSFTATSAGYVRLTETYALTDTPTKIVVQLKHKSKKGKIYLDSVSLALNDLGTRSGDAILPPPSAPGTFRGSN